VPQSSGKPFLTSPPRAGLYVGIRNGTLAVLGAVLMATGAGIATPRAEAQAFFDTWNGPTYKVRKKKVKPAPSIVSDEEERSSGKKSKDEAVAERPIQGPLVVNVSLARQRLTVYDASGPIAVSPVSSGRVGNSTPMGVFSIVQKKRMHHSNLYNSAPMPNMQRITWSGVALHAGVLPGYPASHGCIRLPQGFSKKLYGMTPMGTRVIVSRDPVAPMPIEHPRLFTAFPPDGDLAMDSTAEHETRVADASGEAGVIGVTMAAVAAEAPPSAHLNYRERRRLEAEKLDLEIRTAGYAKAEKTILLKQAQEAAATARAPLAAARVEAARLAKELRDLERSLASAERELAELNAPPEETPKGKRKAKKVMDESKRIAKINTLEAKVARLPSEIEATRAVSQHADEVLSAAETIANEAEEKRSAAADELMAANEALDEGLAKERAAKKLEAKRSLPVSIFISRAKQRLYIRQGYEDVLDVAVTFDRQEEAIGTHVFTALAVAENKTDMKWSVASIPYDPTRSAKKKKDKQAKADPAPVSVDLASQTAAAALDRITVPEDVREQIADVMKPNSTIIISDLPLSNETGAYTDFIASLR
jgi:lipoprotein-anchoring transpeptidase ErfK/SrfK